MDGAGALRDHGNVLDPSAQEYHPAVANAPTHFTILTPTPPQLYYPFPPVSPLPPPPPIHLPSPMPPPAAYQFFPHQLAPPSPPAPPPARQQTYVSHGPAAALPDMVPTRSLLLSSVPAHVTEGVVRVEMEVFGEVRSVEMGRLATEGIVTVHFYDLRDSRAAMEAVRDQHVRQQARLWHQLQQPPHHSTGGVGLVGNWIGGALEMGLRLPGMVAGAAVWAQFAPEAVGFGDGFNNGSLVVFNLDPAVSSDALKQVFQEFGALKETRETPMKPRHRFVEFYDTRHAVRALSALNGKELFGRRVVIEFSRPGGHGRSNYCRKSPSSLHPSMQLPPRLIGLTRTSSGNKSSSSSSHGRGWNSPPPEAPAPECSSSCGGKRIIVNNSTSGRSSSSSSGTKGVRCHQTPSSAAASSSLKQHRSWKSSHHSSSSSSGSSSRNRAALEARFMIKLGDRSSSNNDKNNNKSCINPSADMIKGDAASSSPSPASLDSRTTVMIKNIPNKYSQKLLLNMLDNHCIHCNEQIVADGEEEREPFSSYDFVYLPIDFNNKCNVGYGFVNMTSPEATWRLYKAFHMQPWEVFNSRKICQITYARLQGLEALMEHFRNSKFACDNDEYMPVVFCPPRDGKTTLTEPAIIGGRGSSSTSSSPSHRLATQISVLNVSAAPSEGGDSSSLNPSDQGDDNDSDNDDDGGECDDD